MQVRVAVQKVLELKKHRQRLAERALTDANTQKKEAEDVLSQERNQLDKAEETRASYESDVLAKSSEGMSCVHLRNALQYLSTLEDQVATVQKQVNQREDELKQAEKAVDTARAGVSAAHAARRKMESLDARYLQRQIAHDQAVAEAELDSEPPRPTGMTIRV